MNTPTERSIFLNAIEKTNPDDRAAFLDEECRNNPPLRSSVEKLLAVHERQGILLDQGLPLQSLPGQGKLQTTVRHAEDQDDEWSVRSIGPYRLMEQIGEGGFGIVYVAQQEQPVRRRVALKMVKPGMGSRDVIARFEAERQALAMMDHPHIARVFDAGVTDDARPYFVMELVRGVPITEYCDKARLKIQERLELFLDVCSAVQHAHQKGVIHRDLKPSNILTTRYDDKAVAKVIDFGIAKAIGQSLTDKTIYTGFMAMMGTPLYMSPEQAEMNSLDIDTRSDIYSLGVVLYELLTGTTPIDRSRIDTAGYHEIRRIILEDEPPIPSNRVSTLGNRLATVSGTRQLEPGRFRSSIQGDLDWIVMKAMDKDRRRRYDSAAALARDIRFHLANEPVDARPPSGLYRLNRLARRNRVALITASLVVSSLIAGTAASLIQMSHAMTALKEKDDALEAAVKARQEANDARNEIEKFSERMAQANVLTSSGQTHADTGRWQAAHEDYTQAVTLLPSYYLPWVQRAQMYTRLNLWNEAATDFAKAISLGAPTDLPQWTGVGALLVWAGHQDSFHSLLVQESARINKDTGNFTWQSVRNCVVSGDASIELRWDEIARSADEKLSRISRTGPPVDFGRGRKEKEHDFDRGKPFLFRGRHDDDPRDRNHPEFGGERRNEFLPRGVQSYVTGLAFLRAGDFETAITRLKEAGEDRGWPGKDLVHAPLAIALHHSGQEVRAKEALAFADGVTSRWTEFMLTDKERSSLPVPWFDYIETAVFHAEATAVITGIGPQLDGRLDQIRENALKKLSSFSADNY